MRVMKVLQVAACALVLLGLPGLSSGLVGNESTSTSSAGTAESGGQPVNLLFIHHSCGGQLMAEVSAEGHHAARVRVKDISRGGVRLGVDTALEWADTSNCVVHFLDEARRVRPAAVRGRIRRRGVDEGASFLAIEFAQPLDELALSA